MWGGATEDERRAIRQATVPQAGDLRVLSVDDFAFRRGATYGTILLDLQRRRVVDLLPELRTIGYRGQLENLLQDPAMLALIAQAPGPMVKALRPLCRALRLSPDLLARAIPKPPEAEPSGEAPARKPPPKVRPKKPRWSRFNPPHAADFPWVIPRNLPVSWGPDFSKPKNA